jgi:beta-galactosidase
MMRYEPIIKKFPHFLHGGDYNPDQWQRYPEIINEDFRLMPLAGCNTFSIGIFAWTSYEPEEGVFNFDWLDHIMDLLAEHGYNAILATPSGAMPAWMAQRYPEIRRINREGLRTPYQNRHNHCWTSPVYRKKVALINRKLAERYRQHPALAAWHISNEYSGECFCELCLGAFQLWLKNKYQCLDNLNDAWWTEFWSHRFTDWNQINPRDYCVDGLALDWKRFNTWQCCDFILHETAPLKELTPAIPAATNMMGVSACLDYWRIAEVCDFIADDCYPSWDNPADYAREAAVYGMYHDMHRSMKQGRPFLMMESTPSNLNWKDYYRLKRPGIHQLEMLLSIGHGADGTMYFQWRSGKGGCEKLHGAVVDHNGNEHTRVFRDIANIGKIHKKIDAVVGSEIKVQTAVIHDWEVRWALDVCGGPTKENKKILETVQAHYRSLWNLNVPMEVIESTTDFSRYKVLVAPMLFMVKPGVAERLKKFVADGGTLVCTYLSGYVNDTNHCFTGGRPGAGLQELFGIWNEELDGFSPHDQQSLKMTADNELGINGEFNVVEFAEIIHLRGAKVMATFCSDFYAGSPALTVNRYGQGRAYYLAGRAGDDFMTEFYCNLITAEKIITTLPSDVPIGVHATIRTDGTRKFMFLFNFSQKEVTVNLGDNKFQDMLNGEEFAGRKILNACSSTVLEIL